MSGAAQSRGRKLAIGTQVALATVLAVGVAFLLIDLSERSYLRFDLTAEGRNTLDPAVADLIDRLPEEAEIDVFFRALQRPYDRVAGAVQARTLEYLFLAANARRDKVDVRVHDPHRLEAVQARQRELGIEGTNLLVVTCGERHTTLSLFGDVSDVNWGNPTEAGLRYLIDQGLGSQVYLDGWNADPQAFRGPELVDYRGEEAFAQALAKVSTGEALSVYVATGQGEPDVFGSGDRELDRLRRALERDGFRVATWQPSEVGAVPEDCSVLVLAGARQPYAEEARAAVRDYVSAGGRLLAAPAHEEVLERMKGGIAEVLFGYGMLVEEGVLCETFRDRYGRQIEGQPENAGLSIGEQGLAASNPITEPLRRRGRRVEIALSPALRPGQHPGKSSPLALVSSSPDSWLDLPDERGDLDFRYQRGSEERGRKAVALYAEFGRRIDDSGETIQQSRVLGLATASLLENGLFDVNRDFVLNGVNHLAERDWRVGVSPRERRASRIDLRGRGPAVLTYVLGLGLPAVLILVGCFVAWRRRR